MLQLIQDSSIINHINKVNFSLKEKMDNCIGKVFGKWAVLRQVKVEQKTKCVFKYFECRCECGFIKNVRASDLRTGKATQCKSCSYKMRTNNTVSPLIGQKFSKWTVLSYEGKKYNSANVLKCRCECGNERLLIQSKLVSGSTKECVPCANTKNNKLRAKHNMVDTSTYNIWRSMTKRCRDPKAKSYNCYGGRGIKVCDKWLTFTNFYADMGTRPEGHEIDRINNDGNYEPGNCRWVTPKVNANNRRKK